MTSAREAVIRSPTVEAWYEWKVVGQDVVIDPVQVLRGTPETTVALIKCSRTGDELVVLHECAIELTPRATGTIPVADLVAGAILQGAALAGRRIPRTTLCIDWESIRCIPGQDQGVSLIASRRQEIKQSRW